MSNTKRARWTEAQVTAANAEQLLGEFLAEGQAHAARTVIMRDVAARYADQPGLVAALEQAALDVGDEYWAGKYRETCEP